MPVHCCVMALTLSTMFRDFCRAPNYFESGILTTFPPLLRQGMLTLLPAVSASDDGKDDACASVETCEVTIIAFCMRWLSISRSKARMQKLALVTQALGLSSTWDQIGGRKQLAVSVLPSMSVNGVNNAKSASSACQHGCTSCQ